jgi:hypothetical protein
MVIWYDDPPSWKRLVADGSGALYYSPENPAESSKYQVIKITQSKPSKSKSVFINA